MNRLMPLLSWIAFPVYVWQGIGVRLRTPRLTPPPGAHRGNIAGDGEEIRLLVLGDSSAASVGVDDAGKGLAANLAALLNERTARPVHWRAAGMNSATTGQIRDFCVPNLQENHWTDIVISAGTNDTKNFHTIPRFKREFGGLLYALNARYPGARIYWCPMMEMRDVPALPRALGKILGIRADAVNDMGRQLCEERFATVLPRLPVEDRRGFSPDGFHASEYGYRSWAEFIIDAVAGHIEGS
jgi:lysophospholipase L1-like esterase